MCMCAHVRMRACVCACVSVYVRVCVRACSAHVICLVNGGVNRCISGSEFFFFNLYNTCNASRCLA